MADNNFIPKTRQSRPQAQKDLPFTFPVNSQSYDLNAFDTLVATQGILVKHLKAMPDPRGFTDRGDYRRSQNESNSDGLIYKEAGCFNALFQSNDKLPEFMSEGELDISQALMTPSRFYTGSQDIVILNVFDRFEIQNIELRVSTSQLFESSSLGRDRLNFPAVCVEYLVGADGFEYQEGTHFTLNNQGEVQWTTQRRPTINLQTGKGEICSVRYRYVPYFTVRRLLHEIRLTNVSDPTTGVRRVERLPYQCQVARENVYRDRMKSDLSINNDPRLEDGPSDGGEFGPQGG